MFVEKRNQLRAERRRIVCQAITTMAAPLNADARLDRENPNSTPVTMR
jgi:hypothetical protein